LPPADIAQTEITRHPSARILYSRAAYAFARQAAGFLWRNRRWGNYALVALVLLFMGLGIVSFSIAFTSKDLGIQVATDGTIVEITDGSLAQQTGAVVGATAGPHGESEWEYLQNTLRAGQTATIPVVIVDGVSGAHTVEVRVMAKELPWDQKLAVIIEPLTVLIFMALGLILLQTRKQHLVTYLLFFGFEAGGIMEMTAQSSSYSAWAGIGWAIAMPLTFGTFAHLHMYFPSPRLGRFRSKATIALYGATTFLIILNLLQTSIQATGTRLNKSPWYDTILFVFIAGCLLLSAVLLIRTAIENRAVRDKLVTKRLAILRFAAASFLLFILQPIVMLLTHLDTGVWVGISSFLASWVLAIGYTMAMFQGERRLEANLVLRKRVIVSV